MKKYTKFIIKIITYKLERKRKVYNNDLKEYITERKDRIIHPI